MTPGLRERQRRHVTEVRVGDVGRQGARAALRPQSFPQFDTQRIVLPQFEGDRIVAASSRGHVDAAVVADRDDRRDAWLGEMAEIVGAEPGVPRMIVDEHDCASGRQ